MSESSKVIPFSVAPMVLEAEAGKEVYRRLVKCVDNNDGTFTVAENSNCHPSKDEVLQSDGIFIADQTITIFSDYLSNKEDVSEEEQYLSYDATNQTFSVLSKEDVDKFISL